MCPGNAVKRTLLQVQRKSRTRSGAAASAPDEDVWHIYVLLSLSLLIDDQTGARGGEKGQRRTGKTVWVEMRTSRRLLIAKRGKREQYSH